jgi:hypothetical protein
VWPRCGSNPSPLLWASEPYKRRLGSAPIWRREQSQASSPRFRECHRSTSRRLWHPPKLLCLQRVCSHWQANHWPATSTRFENPAPDPVRMLGSIPPTGLVTMIPLVWRSAMKPCFLTLPYTPLDDPKSHKTIQACSADYSTDILAIPGPPDPAQQCIQ